LGSTQESRRQLLSGQEDDKSSRLAEYERLMAEHNGRLQQFSSQQSE
jgi:hypothetical protein